MDFLADACVPKPTFSRYLHSNGYKEKKLSLKGGGVLGGLTVVVSGYWRSKEACITYSTEQYIGKPFMFHCISSMFPFSGKFALYFFVKVKHNMG